MSKSKISRRIFLAGSTAAMAGCATQGRMKSLKRLGYRSPNEKLNVAAIGAGGKGESDIGNCEGENVIALCDPDRIKARNSIDKFDDAKLYSDFRVMLDKEGKNIDACTVSTPDHVHYAAAMSCIQRGIHVYVQKPMTHTVEQARKLAEAARKYGVATQMGNQGHSGEGVRRLCEMIWAGDIGDVREVHAWTNRPIWPQGTKQLWPNGNVGLLPEQSAPDTLNWDLWIGPSAYRPYNSAYAPFKWRGWWDFGCGALGDMACHILDGPNFALQLTAPVSVECVRQDEGNDQTFPTKSIIRYEFPKRGTMPPVTLYWYDGGIRPPVPQGVSKSAKLGDGDNGSLFIGDKGIATTGCYAGETRLLPDERMKEYKFPDKVLTRSPGHAADWLRACKGGSPACSNFDYAGPFTEWVVLGNACLKFDQKLLWDAKQLRFTNCSEANELISRPVRKGWEV